MRPAVALLLALGVAGSLFAQQPAADPLVGRLPPEAAAQVHAIAARARARALPAASLVQKAIEGAAKGVPAARIVAAVQALADQLASAAGAIHDAGITLPDSASIEAGAFALTAGLSTAQVRTLTKAAGTTGRRATALGVAGTLAALGVPTAQTVDLVSRSLGSAGDLNDLAGQVEAGMAHGQSAAAGLAHGHPATPNPHRPATAHGGSRKP